MTRNPTDLARSLATLTERFAGLASRLAQATRELQISGTLPAEALLEEIARARGEFVDLRSSVFDAARAMSAHTPPMTEVDSLKKLEAVMRAVLEAIAMEERRQATAEARKRALVVLDRVLAIAHVDDPGFGGLVQCQAKAKELRQAILDPRMLETQSPVIMESTPAFAALLTLIEGREQLDDDRFAALEDNVTQSFGRQLAVAATRGKLMVVVPVTPPSVPARPAAPPARPAPPPPTRPIEETVRSGPARAAQEVVASTPTARLAEAEPGAAPAVGQAGQDEGAQWWVSAWARWTSWKSTLAFNDAVKQELQKYSYLLSVPIQKSTDYEEGLLSYGYSILLEFLERQNTGFVNKALNSLKTLNSDQARCVGAHLYDFLVTEGRLSELYPEFVKSVLMAAVPEPGVWTQARILESTVETRVFAHPSARIGDTEHNSQRLTQDRQRFTDHRFPVTLPPLTTRFFAVAGDLRESRVIEVKLTEGRQDSDSAWLLTMPPVGRTDLKAELVRLSPEGTSLPGLGKDYATLWVAVFNTDPAAQKKYDLVLGLRKEAGAQAGTTFRPARV